jgi:hypothetical protein
MMSEEHVSVNSSSTSSQTPTDRLNFFLQKARRVPPVEDELDDAESTIQKITLTHSTSDRQIAEERHKRAFYGIFLVAQFVKPPAWRLTQIKTIFN